MKKLSLPETSGVDITLDEDEQGVYLLLHQHHEESDETISEAIVLRPHEVEALIDFWLEHQGGHA